MSEPTDADRKTAAELIWWNRPSELEAVVAKALAEERARAQQRPNISPELRWVAERTYRAAKNTL